MLRFHQDYYTKGTVGMAITSGHYDQRQKLVDALEALAAASEGDLKVYVGGEPLSTQCERMLNNLQRQCMSDHGQVEIQS